MRARWLTGPVLAFGLVGAHIPLAAQEVTVVRVSLHQITKDLILLRDQYLRADGAARAQLLGRLRELARQRALALQAILPTNPEFVLDVVLSREVYDTIPADIHAHLERAILVEGTIEPSGGPAAQFPYRLRDARGRRFQLYPISAPPPFASGALIHIEGVQVGEALVFRGERMTVRSRSGTDTQPPAVAITSPPQGAVVRGSTTIQVAATDNQRVAQVNLWGDGKPLGQTEWTPYHFTWDTTRETEGPHTLVARATDQDLNIGSSPPVIATVDNTPPRVVLTAPPPKASVSGTVELKADAKDAIGLDSVKFLVNGLSVGVVVAPPYALAWDSAGAPNGKHIVEALATDRAGNTATSDAHEVLVLNANQHPVLDPISPKTVQEGTALTFILSATDADGTRDPLQFRAMDLPPWASFDPASRQFYGTPDFTECSHERPAKTYEGVRFEVCDAQPLCDQQDTAITVLNVNRPPVMNPLKNAAIREGEALTIAPVVMDPDGDPLVCTAEPIPVWAEFDAAGCIIRGSPNHEVASRRQPMRAYPGVLIQACDPQQQCVSQTVTITAVDVNRRPAIRLIGEKILDEGTPLQFAAEAEDPDRDDLTWLASELPAGAAFEETGSERAGFQWTPREDQAGSYVVSLAVTDGQLQDSETFTIRVRETTLSISGTVLDDLQRPMAGVTIRLGRTGEREHTALTDVKGCYVAGPLPRGTYTVRAELSAGNLPTKYLTHFGPLSQRVELIDADRRDIDFTGYTKL